MCIRDRLANRNVPGTVFFLLSALKTANRATFVGESILSNRFCQKSVVLPDGNGAIEGMAYGMCLPNYGKRILDQSRNLMGEQIHLRGGFLIPADIQSSEQDHELMRNIREHINSD